jgi:HEAT repeat protein
MRETNKVKSIGRVILIFFFLFSSVIGFGKINSEKTEAIEILILALKDGNSYVRESAAEALGKIKSERALDPLIMALKDEAYFVRDQAVYALLEIKSAKAIEPLIKALKLLEADVYFSVADALAKMELGEAIEPLLKALKHADNLTGMGSGILSLLSLKSW